MASTVSRTARNLLTPIAAFKGVKVYPAEMSHETGVERVQHFVGMAGYVGYEKVPTGLKEGKRPTAGRLRSMRWRKS